MQWVRGVGSLVFSSAAFDFAFPKKKKASIKTIPKLDPDSLMTTLIAADARIKRQEGRGKISAVNAPQILILRVTLAVGFHFCPHL